MSPTEQGDLQVVKLALDYSPQFFRNASDDVQKNQAFILGLLRANSILMMYVPCELKQDPNFMLQAIAVNFKVVYYADWLIRNNPTFLYKAVRVNNDVIPMLPMNVRNTLVLETKLAAALYLYARAGFSLELCGMILHMQ